MMTSGCVDGCRMELLRSREPIGVSVSFINPNKQSFDLAFCTFWMSSKDRMVERSINIDPSEGWYFIRRELWAKVRERLKSTYFSAYELSVRDLETVCMVYTNCRQTACREIISSNCNFDSFYVFDESELLDVIEPQSLRPISTIHGDNLRSYNVALNQLIHHWLRVWWTTSRHDENLRWIED